MSDNFISPPQMPEMQEFDPQYYFGLVADNLLRNFGARALFYADEALQKMRAIGDQEGFDLWLNIHEHLSQKAADRMEHPSVSPSQVMASSATIH